MRLAKGAARHVPYARATIWQKRRHRSVSNDAMVQNISFLLFGNIVRYARTEARHSLDNLRIIYLKSVQSFRPSIDPNRENEGPGTGLQRRVIAGKDVLPEK